VRVAANEPRPLVGWSPFRGGWGGIVRRRGRLFTAIYTTFGKRLWQWLAGQVWRSSPMTYMFDGEQYIAAVVGSNIMASGLVP